VTSALALTHLAAGASLPGNLNPARGSLHVVVVDNYDSFTYNLVQYLEAAGARCDVRLNDRSSVSDIQQTRPDGVVISPGPGSPDEAGITLELIRTLAGAVPIFGVCLGHQALAQAFGATIRRASAPVHGKTSLVEHDGRTLFRSLPSPFQATRYHSLLVEEASLPAGFEVSARSPQGEIMALRHSQLRLEGVQFHPESILTEHGTQVVQNWLASL